MMFEPYQYLRLPTLQPGDLERFGTAACIDKIDAAYADALRRHRQEFKARRVELKRLEQKKEAPGCSND